MSETPVVQMRNITKGFPGIVANENVDFEVRTGEIHALLGENGAGKSTLMNVLAGLYKQDVGDVFIHGKKVDLKSPKDALAAGVGMIHQHFKLVQSFTVLENIVLGYPKNPSVLREKTMEESIVKFCSQYGLQVDPKAKIWQLSVGEQQRVEIIKVLYRGADILILDEPTAVLTPQETQELFKVLRKMVAAGCSIIIITHKLHEVIEIADRVSVIRKGQMMGTVECSEVDTHALAKMMVGTLPKEIIPHPRGRGEKIIEVHEAVCLGNKGLQALKGISFDVYGGEIMGVAGVAGNGQKELAEMLGGMRRLESGSFFLEGKEITNVGARETIKSMVGFIPEDRLGTGLIGSMDVADNLILKDYWTSHVSSRLWLNTAKVQQRVKDIVEKFDVAVADTGAPVRLMSGGNMQKVLFAREVMANPKALVAAYPARGLDIGATDMIYRLMMEQRARGCSIVWISEDLECLLKYADRIMVLYQGQIMGIVKREEANEEMIGMMMLGSRLEEVVQ